VEERTINRYAMHKGTRLSVEVTNNWEYDATFVRHDHHSLRRDLMNLGSSRLLIFTIPLVIGLLLSACYPSHRAPFVITSPHNRTTYPLNAAIPVQVDVMDLTHLIPAGYAYTPTWDHYEYEIYYNDQLIASNTNVPLSIRVVTSTIAYDIYPGQQWLDVRGRAARSVEDEDGLRWMFSPWYTESVCFWVGPGAPSDDYCSVRTIVQPVQPATPTASPMPPTPTPEPIVLEAQANPNPLYYGEACPALSTVTLQAALAIPAGMTADLLGVDAHMSVMQGSSSNTVGELVLPLEPSMAWDTSTGGQVFSGTVDIGRPYEAAGSQFDPASLGGNSGAILWYVEVSSGGGDLQKTMLLERSANQVIDLAPCPQQGQPAGERPGGGSGPGGSGDGCGQYGNQLSCNLAGCSWNPQDSVCIVSP
jgi:hypothetical protein